jgi:hypothetical protein
MTQAFVIGNGISRQGIDLTQLRLLGTVYGCNALYREFTPDVLVATDRAISAHIEKTGYPLTNKFYTRRPIPNSGALALPKQYYGYSSGPNACALAASNNHVHIYMLGFDMGPTQNQKFNNIYAGSEFYKPLNATPTYTGNWVKQIVKIAHDFPNANFIRLTGPTTARIPELEAVKNLIHQDLATFADRINNKKDL